MNAGAAQCFELAGRRLGAGAPCFLVAEIGINHNGDLALARRSIEAAARAGADAVKFQNYRTEDFLGDRALRIAYTSQGRRVEESQYELFKRCELAPGALAELRVCALEHGLEFFSTPTSTAGVAELVALGCRLIKNGSDFLGHLPLVRALAGSGLVSVLSTGMATLAEIDESVRAFRAAGGRELVLLHCTSSYPTPPEDVHLAKIAALAAAFGCPAGFSDHTEGIEAALGAVALGACMIEKHFTLDRALPGPDQRFSSDPAEFGQLCACVRRLERMRGESRLGPTPSEELGRAAYRLSCVASAALPAGAALAAEHIALRRPGTGLPPAAAEWLRGKRLARALAAGEPIGWEHLG